MSTILPVVLFAFCLMFLRAFLVTLGFYKEPILSAFQRYGDEVGFSPLFEACVWGLATAYLIFCIACAVLFPHPNWHIRLCHICDALLARKRQRHAAPQRFPAFPQLVSRDR